MKDNVDVANYLTIKHSWKGKYRRIFSVGTVGITTYNPATLEVTNEWRYEDFYSIKPVLKPGSIQGEFVIAMRKKNSVDSKDSMRFSSEYTPEILSQALKYSKLFANHVAEKKRFNAVKHHWSDSRLPIILEVAEASLNQIDQRTGRCVAEYFFKDIIEVAKVSDYPGGFVLATGQYRRLHLFAAQQLDELLTALTTTAFENIGFGVRLARDSILVDYFHRWRIGKQLCSDLHLTSLVEYTVQKISQRHSDPVRRILCLTEKCLLERDPASYAVVTVHSLSEIYCLVRCESNPQQFHVEYISGVTRTFTSNERDHLLASLLDGVRASGNIDIHVRSTLTCHGLRIVPLSAPVDEDSESQHMKFVFAPPAGLRLADAIQRFNANIPYSGLTYSVTQDRLFSENKEKLIVSCLQAVLDYDDSAPLSVVEWENLFQALRRLFASKAGFHAFTNIQRLRERLGKTVITALKLGNETVNHAAIDALCALMQPMHSDYEIRQEQLNKSSLLSSKGFLEHLMDMMTNHVTHGTGTLVICSMLDFLTYALCVPYSETTLGEQFDTLLGIVAAKGRIMFKLFQYSSTTIVKGAGLVMRAIIEESDATTSAHMQELALAEGALLAHLHTALFTQSKDIRMLTNRQLSRHLVGLWTAENVAANGLLKRTFPAGLLTFLDLKDDVPFTEDDLIFIRNNLNLAQGESDAKKNQIVEQIQEQWNEVQKIVEKQMDSLLLHWKLRQSLNFARREDKTPKPVVLRKRRERVKSSANWKLFFYQVAKDHSKCDLIWNHKTREELREALENELRMFNVDREVTMAVPVAWNHCEFEVHYACLANEVRIGDYFLRVLLDEDKAQSSEPTPILRPSEFFFEIYHHFLLSVKSEMRSVCLQAMTVIYARYHDEIGPFSDTRFIVAMLDKCVDYGERDRLLLFLSKLVLVKKNVMEIVSASGLRLFVDLLTLAHLHVSRAYIPTQTNVIEASANMSRASAPEWYYNLAENERVGPFGFDEMKGAFKEGKIAERTRCWAQGLEGWKPLAAITQFRWSLIANGTATMNESELAVLILNMLIKMCEYSPSRDADGCVIRPVPKVKRVLSEPSLLPHIVQLLLTFDPVIVEKTATLLFLVVQDNPCMSRLYLSGVYFFMQMYTGSNVLPIARFLHYTHMKQAFRSELHAKSDLIQCSVLSPLVPEAAIFYLENYGAEKYAEVFLGEFDNPEVIWNAEMRRHMIGRIAVHVADFSIRMPSNVRALYQYCPVPSIIFPQLEAELFCYIYYLRHLCNTIRFPDWPIKDPVEFLKACLLAWHEEVEKKPPTLTIDDACEVLGISPDTFRNDESVTRKAYFKLAQIYHPDKNPEGREMFEKVSNAYEFLCSRQSKAATGPDPERIILCIKGQTIVYSRYSEDLAPYKYAGYTQLIKTIRLEAADDALFSKSAPLLAAAAELCYHTLCCSALNAEQLRRENGLDALQEALNRCVNVLSESSKADDLAVQVCLNVCRCYATAAQFSASREKLSEMPAVFNDICRILRFKHLTRLCSVAAAVASAFSVCSVLQMRLFQSGIIWHILPNLFAYDYTLDEGGVQKAEESNQQELANKLARTCCDACACLAGYREACPPNDAVQSSLRALLTPYVNRLMKTSSVDEVLKLLNSNTESPYIIWNNNTRVEVIEYIKAQAKLPVTDANQLFGADFQFSAFQTELIIGEIFIRIYNEQPTFILDTPKAFCMDLLDFINGQAQYLLSWLSLTTNKKAKFEDNTRLQQIVAALTSLRNVLRSTPGLEFQCIGQFKLLFALLSARSCAAIQACALEVISLAAVNQECVSDMAASGGVVHLLLLLQILPQQIPTTLSTLLTLGSNTQIVKDTLTYGGLIYFLDLVCNSDDGDVRVVTAELLAKMLADRLNGPRCRLLLTKFLPPIFLDAMRDSPRACVDLFDGTTENPELIWNEGSRVKVCQTVRELRAKHFERQLANSEETWKLPEGFNCVYEEVVSGELIIGGVFLRLFVANPSWVLRNSRQFLTELLDATLQQMRMSTPNEENLETLSTALVSLLQNQPAIMDQIPAQGYLPQLCDASKSQNPTVAKACILILQQLSQSKLCVEYLAKVDSLTGMIAAMKSRPDLLPSAAQAMRVIFEKDNALLVQQALRCKLVEYLLSLLGAPLAQLDNPQAVKAELVSALKSMSLNLEHGDQVLVILTQSSVWSEFKDQRHDLFIQSASRLALTGGSGVAGYLTQGLSAQQGRMQTVPPP